ncbi:LysE/ArgO family amino acid transporter [Vreelandella titanicae]|uniref:LysE/ArgO family amino acid transporter n=1 Tax=Vreelandella titanicae TaxID=664683 RepID=UPI003FD6C197
MLSYLQVGLYAFLFATSIIIAIGPQNIFIIKQSIYQKKPYLAAFICASCDFSLITLGVYILSSHINDSLLSMLKWIGILFLIIYAITNIKEAINPKKNVKIESNKEEKKSFSAKNTIRLSFAFSLLNPHVYIDTVLILGSLGAKHEGYERLFFIIGASFASYLWFFLNAYIGTKMIYIFSKPAISRSFDILVSLIMLAMAYTIYKL